MMKKSGRNGSFTGVQSQADLVKDPGFSARRGKNRCDLLRLELSLPHRFLGCP
jgi:hypothetical protein